MNDKNILYAASLLFATSLALVWRWGNGRARLPFPPGPKGLPLLGNVLDIPRDVVFWQALTSLAQKFNTDVLYLRLLKMEIVVLNSPKAISDLCEKRSNIYSDRPPSPMFELMGYYNWNVAIVKCGNWWKNCRRLLHEFLNPRAVIRFDDYQRKHASRFMLRLAETPSDFLRHTEFSVWTLVMEMTYGMDITDEEHPTLRAAIEMLHIGNRAAVPGAFLVDVIPTCTPHTVFEHIVSFNLRLTPVKYLPEWFPGVQFKTFARVSREKADIAISGPLEYAKGLIKSGGGGNASIASSSLSLASESPNQGFDESVIRGSTATLYFAAVDTTIIILYTFFLAMSLNPHVLRKAQAELDRVVGDERLPDFSDREDLPYVSAILKEVVRWGCPVPVGIPKRVTENDIYNGNLIPAGAIIIENIWSIFYNESTYPNPQAYDPERFLKDGKLDPSVADPEGRAFGSGRRICPGQPFVIRTLFLNIACILALFNIEPPVDEGLEAKFVAEGVIRRPAPFKCRISPRSDARLKLIKSVCVAAED